MDDLFDDFDSQSSDVKNNVPKDETTDFENMENPSDFSMENANDGINSTNDGVLTDEEIRNLSAMIDADEKNGAKDFSFNDEAEKNIDSMYINEPAPVVRTIDKIRRPDVKIDPEHFGETLRNLREAVCISLTDLADELRIKESFLAALEREDYDNLPPEVFIIAYIRKLGKIYRLTDDEITALTQKVRDRMEFVWPEDMENMYISYDHSEENASKLRTIMIALGVAVTALLIGIVLIIIYYFGGGKTGDIEDRPPLSAKESFSSDMLIKLQPEVKLNAPPLKITK